MKRALLLLSLISSFAFGATSDQQITSLISGLRESACQFERGGVWYSGYKAAQHLEDKWNYAKDDINSPEDFINNVARGSWISGSDYHVKCPNQAEMTSRAWLLQQLQQLRTQ